jgi:hypothetical protein
VPPAASTSVVVTVSSPRSAGSVVSSSTASTACSSRRAARKATGDLRQPCIVVAQGAGTGTPRAEFHKLRPAVDAGTLENRPALPLDVIGIKKSCWEEDR